MQESLPLYDSFAKLLFGEICEGTGQTGSESELQVHPRRIDFWYRPDGQHVLPGLLGRMFADGTNLLEFYHQAPGGAEWRVCLQKQVALQSHLKGELPRIYVLSAGRPGKLISAAWLRREAGWPTGFYESAPVYRARLVVISELPVNRSTLLLRLLGAGKTLERAKRELRELPPDSWEWQKTVKVLIALRLKWHHTGEEDVKMLAEYQELYDRWEAEQRELRRQDQQAGELEGLREALVGIYTSRFGAVPEIISVKLEKETNAAQLVRLIPLFTVASQEEIHQQMIH